MAVLSPLRYPGGKHKLLKYTTDLIVANNLKGCTYIEPLRVRRLSPCLIK